MDRDRVLMITFIYGKDTFRSKEYLDNLTDAYYKKYPRSISFYVFDAKEDDLNKVRDIINTPSFFDEKKLIVLKNLFGFNAEVAAWIKNSTDDIGLVFYEESEEKELKKISKS